MILLYIVSASYARFYSCWNISCHKKGKIMFHRNRPLMHLKRQNNLLLLLISSTVWVRNIPTSLCVFTFSLQPVALLGKNLEPLVSFQASYLSKRNWHKKLAFVFKLKLWTGKLVMMPLSGSSLSSLLQLQMWYEQIARAPSPWVPRVISSLLWLTANSWNCGTV